ncbi:hypothetical protein LP7551_03552 [Roseibium album]|nr:hypothetical protein LP7551_03552 [Roseibium album]
MPLRSSMAVTAITERQIGLGLLGDREAKTPVLLSVDVYGAGQFMGASCPEASALFASQLTIAWLNFERPVKPSRYLPST